MSAETERLAELVVDLGNRLSQAFGDVISPEAQRHLRNAQREALTALFLIYEEQVGRRASRGAGTDDEDLDRGWPRDMEEAVGTGGLGPDPAADEPRRPPPAARRARKPPAEKTGRSTRVRKIDLD